MTKLEYSNSYEKQITTAFNLKKNNDQFFLSKDGQLSLHY